MPLQTIPLPPLADWTEPLEAAPQQLIDEADRRIEAFQFRGADPIHGFVPCDYAAVWHALRWIDRQHLSSGRSFCEWGSGFGVVTLLAALLEWDACGIEVEWRLVEQSQMLAEDFDIEAQFAHGSLIPAGGEDAADFLEDLSHIDTSAPSGYDELGLDVDDFDLLFAFPWPGEEGFVNNLFQRYAATGALLLTYHGVNELNLQRKVSGR